MVSSISIPHQAFYRCPRCITLCPHMVRYITRAMVVIANNRACF